VSFSVPTLDEVVWRTTEPGTAPPRARLRALTTLVGAGIKAGVAMAPILPGLSDRAESLAEVVRAAREAGATFLWASPVNLRPGTREHFFEALARDWPAELERYERLFAGRSYQRGADTEAMMESVKALKLRYGIADRRPFRLAPEAEPVQLQLAV
jgi:DNA repair photolyase